LKLLLDENIYGLEKFFKQLRWEVVKVEDALKEGRLKSNDDGEIAQYAKDNGLILITKDGGQKNQADFISQPCILIDDVMIAKAVESVIREKYLKH